MANSKAISVRVPDELLEKIDKLADEKYKSHKGTPNRSLVVLDAITAYFNTLSDTDKSEDAKTVSDSVSIEEFNELREKFITLSDTVAQIRKKVFSVSDNVASVDEEPLEQSQPSIIAVSDNVDDSNKGIDEGLTTAQLASRLGKKTGDITSKKFKTKADPSKFIDWSRNEDPEGYGWEFRSGSTLFYRVAH